MNRKLTDADMAKPGHLEPMRERAEPEQRLPRITTELTRCPTCGGTEHRVTRSTSGQDSEGSWKQQYRRCIQCGTSFVVNFL